jgi:hypothetical protein
MVLPHDAGPAVDDLVEGLIPRDRREPALPLGGRAPQGPQETLGRVDQLVLPVDLGAGESGGQRVIGVALDADQPSILDMRDERTAVGAVVRTRGDDGLHPGGPPTFSIWSASYHARAARPPGVVRPLGSRARAGGVPWSGLTPGPVRDIRCRLTLYVRHGRPVAPGPAAGGRGGCPRGGESTHGRSEPAGADPRGQAGSAEPPALRPGHAGGGPHRAHAPDAGVGRRGLGRAS